MLKKIYALISFLGIFLIGNAQTSVTFNCTGAAQNWTVPACVTSISVTVNGAQGGGPLGGLGASVTGTFTVTSGQTIQLNVGCTPTGSSTVFGGGGSGHLATSGTDHSFAGGGASWIDIGGSTVIVAGGGGGQGGGSNATTGIGATNGAGGAGGCATGVNGNPSPFQNVGGAGGTQAAGGAGGPPWSGGGQSGFDGSFMAGGNGGYDPTFGASGGGGGGGYYGGGGGGSDGCCFGSNGGAGGGGGSSLVPTGGGCTQGVNAGSGSIVITYTSGAGSAIASNTGPYCEGATIQFSSSAGGTSYSWTGPGGFASVLQNPTIPAATTAMNGVYTVNITFPGGCTASDTTTVVVYPTPTVNVPANATYCNGDPVPASAYTSNPAGGTFAWTNSNTAIGLAANGTGNTPAFNATNATGAPITTTITVTPTVNGCPGTPSNYTITVNPVPTVTVPASITYCSGDAVPASVFTSNPAGGTFTWTNSNPTIGLAANGTGNTPAFTAANPGPGPISATITVTPTVNGCVGTPSVYTITVNACTGPTALFGSTDSTLCINDCINFIDMSTNSPTSWTWSFPGGTPNSSTAQNPTGICYNAAGSYDVELIVSNGISDDTLLVPGFITVYDAPTVIVPANATYCSGDAVPVGTFTSNPVGGSFTWTNSNPAVGLAANGTGSVPTFTATNSTGATITTTITVTPTVNGCLGTSSNYTITVNPVPTVTVPANASYCDGAAVPASNYSSSPAGGTFSWTNSNPAIGLAANGNGNTPAFNCTGAPATATITVTPTVNTCVGSSSSYTITVIPYDDATITPAGPFCSSNSAVALNAATSGGTWSGNGITNTSNGTFDPGTAGPGTHTITYITNGTCSSTATEDIVVNPLPTVDFSADTFGLCLKPSQAFEFYNTSDTTGGMVGSAIWNFGDGSTASGDVVSHSYSAAGNYNITLTITSTPAAGSCTNSLTKFSYVQVYPNPIADFITENNPTTIFDPTVYFYDQSQTNIVQWFWDMDGLATSTNQNPVYTFPEDTGNYNVTLFVVDANGCTDSTTGAVIIKGEFGIYVPNAFTPDFDNLNDTFGPQGFGITDNNFNFYIFDRWGEKVYESHKLANGWNGTYKGKLVQCGVYVWRLEFKDINGEEHKYNGHVNVVR